MLFSRRTIYALVGVAVLVVALYATVATVRGDTFFGISLRSGSLSNGLVAHWTFDGKHMTPNVIDPVGGFNGTLTGFTSTSTVIGRIGQALSFDGADDYVSVPHNASLNLSSSYTISAWVYLRATPTTEQWAGIVAKGKAGETSLDNHPYILGYNRAGSGLGSPGFVVSLEASNGSNCNTDTADAEPAGKWYHLVGRFDDTANLLDLFVDGVLEKSEACTLSPNTGNSQALRIGDDGHTVGVPFNGDIDDVRIYNRALSDTEVERLYSLGNTTRISKTISTGSIGATNDSGLVGHWTFDGKNLVNYATDSSGLGKNGLLRSSTGAQTATTTDIGRIGQALSFDGTDDWINITDTTDPTAYTISVWVKPVDTTSRSVFTRASSVSLPTASWSHQLRLSSGGFAEHYLYDGDVNNLVTGTTALVAGEWYHIVGTAQNNGEMKLYVNGAEEGTPDTVGTMWTGGDRWYPGTNTGGSMGYFDGLMDDVRLYNRVLHPDEIQRLYGLGQGTRITYTPPAEENTAPTVSDAGRFPMSGTNLGGIVSWVFEMNVWTDPEGDDVEYFFELHDNTTTCNDPSPNTSGWITSVNGIKVSKTFSVTTEDHSWMVKARDEHGLESGYNTCYILYNFAGGSCPYVFGWDGEQYQFEVDIYGSGGLGYKKWGVSDFVQPSPNRTYVLKYVEPKNGAFEWRIVGDLSEINYFDLFRMYSYFVPEDRDIVVEAPTLGSGMSAKSVLHTVSTTPLPALSAVRLDTNEDVTEAVRTRDDKKVIVNENKKETYEYTQIEVDFGDISRYPTKKLVIGGSTTYPTTEEGIARKQLFGREWGLYVQDAAGKWQKVPYEKYSPTKPLSFDSMLAVDISDIFISNNTKLRLEYLYKVYVDYVALDVTEDIPLSVAEEHPIMYADLHDFGGWHDFDKDGNVPDYYDVSPPEEDYEDFPGYYTRFGDVTPLLEKRDDKFVILAKRDEITVKNTLPEKEPPPGYKRVYMLDVTGYYKALSKTMTPMTVEPMPFSGMSAFPYPETETYPDTPEYAEYLSTYNTRYLSPDIPRPKSGLLGDVERLLEDLTPAP